MFKTKNREYVFSRSDLKIVLQDLYLLHKIDFSEINTMICNYSDNIIP